MRKIYSYDKANDRANSSDNHNSPIHFCGLIYSLEDKERVQALIGLLFFSLSFLLSFLFYSFTLIDIMVR